MNLNKLKSAEATFLNHYPGGFSDPAIQPLIKRHRMDKLITLVQDTFSKQPTYSTDETIDHLVKLVSRSSMVSLFEKPKFRDFAFSLPIEERKRLIDGVFNLLHGNQELGFNLTLSVLEGGKLAKWSLITLVPAYFNPTQEVFVKPTTAKGVIEYFEVSNLRYQSKPNWEFYEKYRALINEAKTNVAPTLSPSNAAFSGFLMMSLPTV